MKEKFKAIVNDNFEFSLLPKDLETLDSTYTKNKSHVLYNGKSFKIEILQTDINKRAYNLKINGNHYRVKIENQLDALISEMGLSLGTASIKDEIHAPMPGLILEVNVSKGDSVQKGDFLCVLEAMKMENTLTAPRDGIVKSISISKGETVDKGMLLIEFEKEND